MALNPRLGGAGVTPIEGSDEQLRLRLTDFCNVFNFTGEPFSPNEIRAWQYHESSGDVRAQSLNYITRSIVSLMSAR